MVVLFLKFLIVLINIIYLVTGFCVVHYSVCNQILVINKLHSRFMVI